MAGVRISAVTAVGLMTIAAFIGAGGLGFFSFLAASVSVNNGMIFGRRDSCLYIGLGHWLGAVSSGVIGNTGQFAAWVVENSLDPYG